jgi:hypothetical protein
MEAVVRARITMTLDNFADLRNFIYETIKDGGNKIPRRCLQSHETLRSS